VNADTYAVILVWNPEHGCSMLFWSIGVNIQICSGSKLRWLVEN